MTNILKKQLFKLRTQIIYFEPDLIEALKKDLNKSEHETLISELYPVYKELKFFIKNSRKITKMRSLKTLSNNLLSHKGHFYKPHGEVLIFSTWNYPFNLALNPFIGAFAMGNKISMSLHPFTPNTNEVISKILKPFDNVEVLTLKTIEEILDYKKWDFIFFTGGELTGEKIRTKAYELKIPYCLELGGKSPVIVTESANLKLAAEQILYGKILNSGQTCVAPDYLIVHESVKDEFDKIIQKEIKNNKLDIMHLDSNISKIINIQTFDNLVKEIDKDASNISNDPLKQKISLCYLNKEDLNSNFEEKEIMGPVVYTKTYKNWEDISKIISSNPNPLIIYLFSENKIDFQRVKTLNSGNLMINATIDLVADSKLSFGGYKNSGYGKYHGWASVELFSFKTAYLKVKRDIYMKFKKYPYTTKKLGILRKYLNIIK